MATIESNSIQSAGISAWGIDAYDYTMNGTQVDFQDLLTSVTKYRATTVEHEIQPLSTRIRNRNALLDKLGDALSTLTGMQANFNSDSSGSSTTTGTFSADAVAALKACGVTVGSGSQSLSKSNVEKYVQLVKSKIDGLNNQAQTDMTRLQSLVDRRDQAYSAATELMQNVSDTRGNLIQNIG